jgi:hypothetical protein
MFRAVIHPLSDQPLVVDIEVMPTATDNALVCFNVRTIDGKRPKFIDRKNSTFIFPLASIRFVEVYSGEAGVEGEPGAEAEPEELEIDEEFLRRVREA